MTKKILKLLFIFTLNYNCLFSIISLELLSFGIGETKVSGKSRSKRVKTVLREMEGRNKPLLYITAVLIAFPNIQVPNEI